MTAAPRAGRAKRLDRLLRCIGTQAATRADGRVGDRHDAAALLAHRTRGRRNVECIPMVVVSVDALSKRLDPCQSEDSEP